MVIKQGWNLIEAIQRYSYHFYFIGIGGSGMNSIAQIIIHLGYQVSGSDLLRNQATDRLYSMGATIYRKHTAENIKGCDVVVISSAISKDNPEVIAAYKNHIPVIQRAEMLGELMRFHYGIAISGTHGKTTTTSLVSTLLLEGGLDPSFVIGDQLNSIRASARLGRSKYLVVEADESDASFLYLQPIIIIITNINKDHMNFYKNDFGRLRDTFLKFLYRLPFYGLAILCIYDKEILCLLPKITRRIITYGISKEADVRATNLVQNGIQMHFDVNFVNSKKIYPMRLNMPGQHNVLNALAAISVAKELNISKKNIYEALVTFQGIRRRFQINQIMWKSYPLILIEDFAHHPKELALTIKTVRENWPQHRLVLVFQPHRYTRLKEQFDNFVFVLSLSDLLILSEVYAAGEQPIPGANSYNLTKAIYEYSGIKPLLLKQINELPNLLYSLLQRRDLLLLVGAGDIHYIVDNIKQLLINKTQ